MSDGIAQLKWNQEFLAETRDEAREDIRAILAAYNMVKDKHPLPTILVAAIEQAKRRAE